MYIGIHGVGPFFENIDGTGPLAKFNFDVAGPFLGVGLALFAHLIS